MATEASLAERVGGECFYMNHAGHGLLLPGEQFLLPVSTAIRVVRSAPDTIEDILDLSDECLHAELDQDMLPHISLADAASRTTDVSEIIDTPFEEVLGPKFLPTTPLLPTVSTEMKPPYIALEYLSELSDEMDYRFGIYTACEYEYPEPFDSLFTGDTWTSSPDFGLAYPVETERC
ncbi:hypothetical protein OPT61_g3000 [Boeremia exigua]|uniref:Uncharacterized protein n=1 Tax=Boeremia exigua TaxID=749465 RepID=A0ACC2IJF3_9PLEO|nr:hypothetical protein OPT61_g3000 [Boeremia exigua]